MDDLKNRGEVYRHGVAAQPDSELHVRLDGGARAFRALAAVDDEASKWAPADGKTPFGTVVFQVWVDGKLRFDSGVVRHREPPRPVDVDLRGARALVLKVADAGDGNDNDTADWLGAQLELAPGGAKPRTVPRPRKLEPTMALAHTDPNRVAINGASVVGATPGKPFVFRIPATGKPPLSFTATPLPEGLALDAKTGIISGVIAAEGTTDVTLGVRAANGHATRRLTLKAGPNQLALTPPLGWNSWNVWGRFVDDGKIRAAVDGMVASGLAAHGYQYVSIDDAWEGGRAASGDLIADAKKFPDMKALGDYVHAQGLRFGIYSSPGPKTCGGFEGSFGHEAQDARTFAAWGVDVLKYDWCSYRAPNRSRDELAKPYQVMRAALDAQPRDLLLAMCQYGMGNVWEWGRGIGHFWRTTGDITFTWRSVSDIGFKQIDHARFGGPGGWNDPDMLVVGKLGWGRTLTPTQLTPNEQITHITIWAMLPAPLLIGADLSQLDRFTLDLLTNDEVLAINQDALGRPAQRLGAANPLGREVWTREVGDGLVVALFNRGEKSAPITLSWDELRLTGPQRVRNVWSKTDLGVRKAGVTAPVAGHGVLLLKLTPAGG